MKTKSAISIALLIFLLSLIQPSNLFAQRNPPARDTDNRIGTRFPKTDNKTNPREKPVIKPKTKEKNPNPPSNENINPQLPCPPDDNFDGDVEVEVVEIIPIWEYQPEPVKIDADLYEPDYKLEGIAEYKDGDYLKALEDLNIAVEEDSNDYELYYYRGLTELKIKFFEEAEEDFTKYLKYSFYEPDGYFQRGLAKFYLNKKAEAKEDFQIAADMDHKMAISILKRFY